MFQNFNFFFYVDQVAVHPINFLFPFERIDLGFKDSLLLWFVGYLIEADILPLRIKKVHLCFLSLEERGASIAHQAALTLDLVFFAGLCSHEVPAR